MADPNVPGTTPPANNGGTGDTPPAGNTGGTGTQPPANNGATGTTPPDTNGGTSGKAETVPFGKFHAANESLKAANAKIAEFEAAEAAATEKKALEAGEHQKVIDSLKPDAERAKTLEASLTKYLDAELAKIPEEKKPLIPAGLSVEAQLDYIATNRSLLVDSTPNNIGHGTNPSAGAGSTGKTFTVSQISDPKFYAENRIEILKAQKLGNIKEG